MPPESLAQTLRRVPDEIFWRDSSSRDAPDYNAVFAWYLRRHYGLHGPDDEVPIADLEAGKVVNVSTFQKSVATERARRQAST